ncbi:MAG: carbon-nitrogen hydrolase [Phycisphaeraceae bacterium]|nr:MAG: carbon-nitrogen hydrolase [Phycisphaeraceae bacterium]
MPRKNLRIAIGQMDCVLGDVGANMATVERLAAEARDQGVELLVLPELALSGYEVGSKFTEASLTKGGKQIRTLKKLSREVGIVLGIIEETEDSEFFNSAMCLVGGEILHVHRKVYLPNYRGFDELRHFGTGRGVWAFDSPWGRMAILICGDAWHLPMPYLAAKDGADILLFLAASSTDALTPSISVRDAWERLNQTYALTLSAFVVFANRVGVEPDTDGGGKLNFWGGSHVCKPDGSFSAQAPIGEEHLLLDTLNLSELRRHRQILPFRRDDELRLTLEVGHRVLSDKSTRRDGFFGLISRSPQRKGQTRRAAVTNDVADEIDHLGSFGETDHSDAETRG